MRRVSLLDVLEKFLILTCPIAYRVCLAVYRVFVWYTKTPLKVQLGTDHVLENLIPFLLSLRECIALAVSRMQSTLRRDENGS